MQGFRKSSAWRWSAAHHQKGNKNGRYYYKHLGLSLLLQWLWCSARGAQGEEFTGSTWELLWGSSGWCLQLSPDLEGFSITKNWGWPWVWSPQGWTEAAHQPCAAQGFQEHKSQEARGRWIPTPHHWLGQWTLDGQNCQGLGKQNLLSTRHCAWRGMYRRWDVEAEPALSVRNCLKKQQ